MGREFAELETNGFTVGLHPSSSSSPRPGPCGSLSIGFEMDDLDSEITNLKDKGVRFHRKILEDGPVRIAFFGVPDNNPLYLSEVKKSWT